jgi:ribonuclease P protein component
MTHHIAEKEVFQEILKIRAFAKTEYFALHRKIVSNELTKMSEFTSLCVGVIVPKRWAKKAVTRNAIKRQIYILTSDLAGHFKNEQHVIKLIKSFDKNQYMSATSKAFKANVRVEIQKLYGLRTQ